MVPVDAQTAQATVDVRRMARDSVTDQTAAQAQAGVPDEPALVPEGDSPLDLFHRWYAEARQHEGRFYDAMALATASPDGVPAVRMVLLKEADARGFVFYSNTDSRKGQELAANPVASLCFHWQGLKRQVRIDGRVERVADEEADAYFAGRPRGSQIGAWASDQSRPLPGRATLVKRVAQATARHAIGTVPRPDHWHGYRVVPHRLEFWQDMPFRLHDRLVFEAAGDGWRQYRLYP